MKKTFLYRAKINKATEDNCRKWLDLCRILYNAALEQRILVYNQHKKSISVYEQMKQLVELKVVFPEFKLIGSQVLQEVLQRLERAFQSFFQRLKQNNSKAGFPRFKGKDRYDSFTLKQAGWKLDGRYLYIKNIGRFKLFLSRAISGTIKTVTIRRTSSGKWFVAFSCDDVPERKLPESIDEVGIDAGVKNLLVDTCGNFIDNPKNFRKSEKVLRRRQRALSRKKKSSYRRRKVRIIVAKTHEKIANQRKDFWHKKANSYIQNFGIIYIENLNIKGMVRNRHLSKSIADCSWGMFFNLLCYKAEEAGRIVIKVNPHGTSQKCSNCGKNVSKDLSVRVHHCSFCGIELDRDLNAAINILRFGQNLRALTQRTAASVARESP